MHAEARGYQNCRPADRLLPVVKRATFPQTYLTSVWLCVWLMILHYDV